MMGFKTGGYCPLCLHSENECSCQLNIIPLSLHDIIEKNGYVESGYGYNRVSNNYTHWITLFKDGNVQMYSYITENTECDKEYDSGVINVSEDELQTLIKIFKKNYE